MNIVLKEKKEMGENLIKLKEEGWSPNTRINMSGMAIIKEPILESDIDEIKNQYPNVEIQYPEKRSFLSNSPFVYVTEHERQIKE